MGMLKLLVWSTLITGSI